MTRLTILKRKLKKNYTYSLDQLCREFGFHEQTIRRWINQKERPLKIISKNPTLIFSESLRAFASDQIDSKKTKVGPTELFCMGCKKSRIPMQAKVAFSSRGVNLLLKAVCPECRAIMNKTQSPKMLNCITPMFKKASLEELDRLRRGDSIEDVRNDSSVKEQKNEDPGPKSSHGQLKLF